MRGSIGGATRMIDPMRTMRRVAAKVEEVNEVIKECEQREKAHQKWVAKPLDERCENLEAALDTFSKGGKYADKGYAPVMFHRMRKSLLKERIKARMK